MKTSILSITMLLFLGGCGAVGAVLYKVMGAPPLPARYTPPKDQPLLILVESAQPAAGSIPEADELAIVLFDELRANQVAPLIALDALHTLRDGSPAAFRKLSVAEIGRSLGAKQVIYISLREVSFDMPAGSEVMRGKIEAKIKVIDTQTADTLFPQDADAENYEYVSQYRALGGEFTAGSLRREVVHGSGIELSRWFYAYKPETMSEENADVKLR